MIRKLRLSKQHKNASSHIIFQINTRTINEESSKTMFLKNFVNLKELQIYGVLYDSQHQGAVKVFNRTIQKKFFSAKDHKTKKYTLEELF